MEIETAEHVQIEHMKDIIESLKAELVLEKSSHLKAQAESDSNLQEKVNKLEKRNDWLEGEVDRLTYELERAKEREFHLSEQLEKSTRMRRDPVLFRDQPAPTSSPPEERHL